MAYVLTGHPGAGPFPHLKDEYCGNYHPTRVTDCMGTSYFDPAKHRLGLPKSTKAGETVQELYEQGWRGRYLLQDQDPSLGLTPSTSRGILDGHVIIVRATEVGFEAIDADLGALHPWIKNLEKGPEALREPKEGK